MNLQWLRDRVERAKELADGISAEPPIVFVRVDGKPVEGSDTEPGVSDVTVNVSLVTPPDSTSDEPYVFTPDIGGGLDAEAPSPEDLASVEKLREAHAERSCNSGVPNAPDVATDAAEVPVRPIKAVRGNISVLASGRVIDWGRRTPEVGMTIK